LALRALYDPRLKPTSFEEKREKQSEKEIREMPRQKLANFTLDQRTNLNFKYGAEQRKKHASVLPA